VEALDLLQVERIDHGVRCEEDDALVERLADMQMPLTVCPLSNLKLCVVPSLAEHNIGRLLRRGLCVTINSDDPAYFGGYMSDNLRATADALNLDDAAIIALAKNAARAAFVSDARRDELLAQIQAAAIST
jgi:adenosine deaminase